MYTLKVSYGYVDEPAEATTEILGTYKTRDEAVEAAQDKFRAIVGDLREICFGEIEGSRCKCYVTYGYYDANLDCLLAGYDHYYYISIIER